MITWWICLIFFWSFQPIRANNQANIYCGVRDQLACCPAPRPLSVPKSIGGSKRLIETPWNAKVLENNKTKCIAAIVSEYHLVAPAHCIADRRTELSLFKVKIGGVKKRTDRRGKIEDRYLIATEPMTLNVTNISVHVDYDEPTDTADIAIIRTAKTMFPGQLRYDIRPICLPDSDCKYDVNETYVEVKSKAGQDCKKYGSPPQTYEPRRKLEECLNNTEYQVCAKTRGKTKNKPPLTVTDNGHTFLYGLYMRKALDNELGVYTRVGQYVEWIREHIKRDNATRVVGAISSTDKITVDICAADRGETPIGDKCYGSARRASFIPTTTTANTATTLSDDTATTTIQKPTKPNLKVEVSKATLLERIIKFIKQLFSGLSN